MKQFTVESGKEDQKLPTYTYGQKYSPIWEKLDQTFDNSPVIVKDLKEREILAVRSMVTRYNRDKRWGFGNRVSVHKVRVDGVVQVWLYKHIGIPF